MQRKVIGEIYQSAQQKTLSAHCKNCGSFLVLTVRCKARIFGDGGRVKFYVECPECSFRFITGKPFNLWRYQRKIKS